MQIQAEGLAFPFRRDPKTSLALVSGDDLDEDKILLVLGTPVGSVPYNREFGSRLDSLRHLDDPVAVQHLAYAHSVEALRRWAPSIKIRQFQCTIEKRTEGSAKLHVRLWYVRVNRSAVTSKPRLVDALL